MDKHSKFIKMKKILLYITIFIGTFSCSSQKNISINFKLENEESLNSYLTNNKVNVEKDDSYILKDFKSFANFNNSDRLQIPEILFFNSQGYLVKNRFNNNECTQVINDIEKINSLEFDKNVKIQDWFDNIKPLYNGLKNNNEYYVIINWAIYVDKINKQSFSWYNELKKSTSKSKVNCILLNLDVMENWNLNDKQKKALNIK